jgi:hypothetical protein
LTDFNEADYGEVPNNISTPITLNAGDQVVGGVDATNDRDFYRLSLTAGVPVVFRATETSLGEREEFNLTLRYFDAAGNDLNPGFGFGYSPTNQAVEYFIPETSGTYYVEIGGYDPGRSYRLEYVELPETLVTANSPAINAGLNVETDTVIRSAFGDSTAAVYQMDVAEGQTVDFQILPDGTLADPITGAVVTAYFRPDSEPGTFYAYGIGSEYDPAFNNSNEFTAPEDGKLVLYALDRTDMSGGTAVPTGQSGFQIVLAATAAPTPLGGGGGDGGVVGAGGLLLYTYPVDSGDPDDIWALVPEVIGKNSEIVAAFEDIDFGGYSYDEDFYIFDVLAGESYSLMLTGDETYGNFDSDSEFSFDLVFLDTEYSAAELGADRFLFEDEIWSTEDDSYVDYLDPNFQNQIEYTADRDGVLVLWGYSFSEVGLPYGYRLKVDGPGDAEGVDPEPSNSEVGGVADPFSPAYTPFTMPEHMPNQGFALLDVQSGYASSRFAAEAGKVYFASAVGIGDDALERPSLFWSGFDSGGDSVFAGYSIGPFISQLVIQSETDVPEGGIGVDLGSTSFEGYPAPRGGNDVRMSVLQARDAEAARDVGDTVEDAHAMQIGEAVQAALTSVDDIDRYVVSGPAGAFVRFTLAPIYPDPLFGVQFNAASLDGSTGALTEIGSFRGGPRIDDYGFTTQIPQSGELIFTVESFPYSTYQGIGSYAFSAVQVFDLAGQDTGTQGTLEVGAPRLGALESGTDRDWFKVTLVQGQSYEVTAGGSGLFAGLDVLDITLRDAGGAVLTQFLGATSVNEDGDTTGRFIAPDDGTFFVDISTQGGGNGVFYATGGEFIVSLDEDDSPGGGGSGGTREQTLTSVAGFQAERGNDVMFTLERSGTVTEALTVSYRIEAFGDNPLSGLDIAGGLPQTGSVTFAAGQTSVQLPVSLLTGSGQDSAAAIRLVVTDTTSADGSTVIVADDDAVGTILGIEPIILAGGNVSVTEGHSGTTELTFEILRDGGKSAHVFVDYEITSAAVNGADSADVVGFLPRSGVVEFLDGETRKTVTVEVAGDIFIEGDESLRLSVTGASDDEGAPVLVTNSNAVGTILNDDRASIIQVTGTSVEEGDEGTKPMTFMLTRGGGSQDEVTVEYRIIDYLDDVDILGGAEQFGSVVFAPGEVSKSVTVQVIGDLMPEANDPIELQITSATATSGNPVLVSGDGFATGLIANDDIPTYLMASAPQHTVYEGQNTTLARDSNGRLYDFPYREGEHQNSGKMEFIIERSGDLDTQVVVDYSVINGITTPRAYTTATYNDPRFAFPWERFQIDFSRLRLAGDQEAVASTSTVFNATTEGYLPFGGFSRVPLSVLWDYTGSQQLGDLIGRGSLPDLDIPLFTFQSAYVEQMDRALLPLSPLNIEVDVVNRTYGELNLSFDGPSLGSFNILPRLVSQAFLPSAAVAGETFDIALNSNFSFSQTLKGETLSFDGAELALNLQTDTFWNNITLTGLGFDLFNIGDLKVAQFDETVTLFDISATDILDSISDYGSFLPKIKSEFLDDFGIDFKFSLPDGRETIATSPTSYNSFSEASVRAASPLFTATLSLFEALGNIPNLKLLDFLKNTWEYPGTGSGAPANGLPVPANDNKPQTNVKISAELTILDLFLQAGLNLVQEYRFTPEVRIMGIVDGQEQELNFGESTSFDVPDVSGADLVGDILLDIGGTLDVVFKLVPTGSIGLEVLKGAFEIVYGAANTSYKAGFGPLAKPTLTTDIFDFDLFSVEGIDIGFDSFADYVVPFSVPVRLSEIPEDALIADTVIFEPGETQKVITLNIGRDAIPEANQEIIFRIDEAITSNGYAAEVFQPTASVTVIDDDDVVRMFRGDGDVGGDPHIVTFDGLAYDFHTVGEFVALENLSGPELELQLRTAPVPGSDVASLISGMAARLGDATVMIDAFADTPLLINGVPTEIPLYPGVIKVGDGEVRYDGGGYAITTAAGDTFKVGVLDGFLMVCVFLSDTREPGSVHGLWGNNDGDGANDLSLRSGEVLEAPLAHDVLYGEFADSWRVTDDTSLFTYDFGQSTADFTDTGFPRYTIDLASLPEEVLASANATLDEMGLTDPILRQFALYDLLLTGDEKYVESIQHFAAVPDTTAEVTDVPDASAVLGIYATTSQVQEGDGEAVTVEFIVYRTGATGEELTLGIDFGDTLDGLTLVDQPPADVTLAAGASQVGFTLQFTGDEVPGSTHVIEAALALATPVPGVSVFAPVARAKILDDDTPPLPSVGIAVVGEATQDEGNDTGATFQFEVTLSETSAEDVTLDIGLLSPVGSPNTDDADFAAGQPRLFTVTIPAGTLSVTFDVAVAGDGGEEGDEAFVARILSVENATFGTREARAVILNDDAGNLVPVVAPLDLGEATETAGPLALDLLEGASDPDGDALSVASVVARTGDNDPVAFALDGGILTLDPAQFADDLVAGEAVTIRFDYLVVDARGAQVVQSASLVIAGENGPFTFYADGDGDGFGTDVGPVTGYTRGEGQVLVGGDADDTDASINPAAVEINDGKDNDQDGAVDEDNQAPVADAETFVFAKDTPLVVATATLLDGDTDADGDVLTVVGVANAVNGTVSLDDKGDADASNDEVIFTPTPGFSGAASFDYTVADGFGGEDSATVSLTVTGGGGTTTETRTFADGRVRVIEYEDGVRSSLAMTDGGDIFNWTRFTDTFDPTGARTGRVREYDNGRVIETVYENGDRVSSLITDAADAFVWDTVELGFDAMGAVASEVRTYDDGRVRVVEYADGLPVVSVLTDVADAYAWTSQTDSFDAAGDRISRVVLYDDGSESLLV